MAGQIPQRFIDDLLARVDVVEVVGERVKLKKAGRNHSGLCPFHQEKSPSFTVSADKQFYHCFGCGAHGNALRFLMEYDNLRFPDAVEHLAARLGLEVPREGADDPRAQARERKRKEGVNLLELSASFFRERLKMPEGQGAREYIERRGLSPEVVRDFGIGYAPGGWESLKRHLGEQGIAEPVQIEYGLLVHREDSGRTYDRFRDRVMFPIRDIRGRTIAFGGRVLGDAKPKYLNSPETPVFHKGRELYGLYEARQANPRLERLVIVEGYMDVVALAQFGIRNAVATLGTATTEDHLGRLFRMVDEVVFCFDGDRAGRQAASRALETVLPQMIDGRQARFLFLPDGEDPDTLVRREGPEAFEDRVTCASPLSEFLFEQAAEGRDLERLEERERFASRVLAAIGRLPEGVMKSLLLTELSRRTGVDQSSFESLMSRGESVDEAPTADVPPEWADEAPPRGEAPAGARTTGGPASLGQMARALQLLVHEPSLVERLPEDDDWCDQNDPDAGLCREVVRLLRAGGYRSPQVLLAHFHGTPEGERLAMLARRAPLVPRGLLGTELDNWVAYFQRHRRQQSPQEAYDALLARMQAGESLSKEERQRLNALLMELKG
ncbi:MULTISPECIES: DNA primase [Halomonas]|uniref:DNA primase n=2 Tax=Halomonas TaxID=2745 RepID=A0ABQ0U351_9GAMM|nr:MULTISPECIES: DNA primase [Halomonas]PSJ23193.1 DNA primase [Halomonas sp. ND22Bw]KGE77378.1 DNA primase [Halomonas salina]MDR5890117.1 DNA primase [Halomonas salina]RAH37903.1 DNA primase [Halomonas sp. SL1]WJY06623.1 DNA primase [Halomonas halophila]